MFQKVVIFPWRVLLDFGRKSLQKATHLLHQFGGGKRPRSWTPWRSAPGCQRWRFLVGRWPPLHWETPSAWSSRTCWGRYRLDRRWWRAWLCTRRRWSGPCCPPSPRVDVAKCWHRISAQIARTGCKFGPTAGKKGHKFLCEDQGQKAIKAT